MLNRTLWVPFTLIDCDGRPLIFSGPSNEVEIGCSHDRRSHEDDDNLSFLNEMLFGVEGAQELHRTQTRDKDEMRGFDSTIEHPAQND